MVGTAWVDGKPYGNSQCVRREFLLASGVSGGKRRLCPLAIEISVSLIVCPFPSGSLGLGRGKSRDSVRSPQGLSRTDVGLTKPGRGRVE